MTTTRRVPFLLARTFLAMAMGCGHPISTGRSAWNETFQAVEVLLPNPAEAQAMAASLGKKLGVPVYDVRQGTVTILRLKPTVNDLSTWRGSLTRTLLTHGGVGALAGLGAATQFASLTVLTAEKTTAVGLILGLGWGIHQYLADQEQYRHLGYYPATCAHMMVEVGLHDETGRYATIARMPPLEPDLRPYLKPLPPEGRTAATIRTVSMRAYTDALGESLAKNGLPTRTP